MIGDQLSQTACIYEVIEMLHNVQSTMQHKMCLKKNPCKKTICFTHCVLNINTILDIQSTRAVK